MAEPLVIYTIGSSTRPPEEFVDILKTYSIELLIDIRRFPTSRFEHFKKENLEPELLKARVGYLYLGKELGGYRSGGYQKYIQAEEFKNALIRVKELARRQTICLMCAERFPWKCHRRFVAAGLEADDDIQVVHIIERDKVWVPKK